MISAYGFLLLVFNYNVFFIYLNANNKKIKKRIKNFYKPIDKTTLM